MDLGKHFESSFLLLKKNKAIFLPVFLFVFLTSLLLGFWIFYSGLNQVFAISAQQNAEAFSALKQMVMGQPDKLASFDKTQRDAQMMQGDILFENLSRPDVWVIGIVFFIILIVATVLLESMKNSMITAALKKQKVSWNACKGFALKKAWSFVGANILLLLIIAAVMVVFVILFVGSIAMTMAGSVAAILGVILAILTFFAMFFAIIYVCVRLMFTLPSLYVDDLSAAQSISASWDVTKKAGKHAWAAYAVVLGLSILARLVAYNLTQCLAQLIYTSSAWLFPLLAVLFLVFYFFYYVIFLVIQVFAYSVYTEFRKLK